MLRLSRTALVATVALFFTLIALGNIVDYGANWQFVTHVMSMDTTFQDPAIMSRAITDPLLQRIAYALIIVWQCLTAFLLWLGTVRLAVALRADRPAFARARDPAILDLTAGFLLYAVGFLVVGGEWFAIPDYP